MKVLCSARVSHALRAQVFPTSLQTPDTSAKDDVLFLFSFASKKKKTSTF